MTTIRRLTIMYNELRPHRELPRIQIFEILDPHIERVLPFELAISPHPEATSKQPLLGHNKVEFYSFRGVSSHLRNNLPGHGRFISNTQIY